MKNNILLTLLSFLFLLSLSELINAQEYGKIFSKQEAEKLFGPVIVSHEIPTSQLQSMLSKTSKVILFKKIGRKFLIVDHERKVMNTDVTGFAQTEAITEDEPLKVYSVTKVQELITNGQEPVTTIEMRSGVMSITNGEYTLEMSGICPPLCQ